MENPNTLELFVPITPSGPPCSAGPQMGVLESKVRPTISTETHLLK